MTPTLEEVQQEFPTAGYAPDPDCQFCQGTGTRGPRKVIVTKKDLEVITEERPEEGHQPCICIFIGDVAIRQIVVDGLRELAKSALTES